MGRLKCTRFHSVALINLCVMSLGGCKNEVSANQVTLDQAGNTRTESSTLAPEAPGSARFDEKAFTVELGSPVPLAVGREGAVTVTLVAKAPFHVNAEYPHRFKVLSVTGGTVAVSVVTRDAGKIEEGKLELPVRITATQAGTGQVDGEVAFSLCTADKCLMEKRHLVSAFQAK